MPQNQITLGGYSNHRQNGVSPGGWTHYAQSIQEAGADTLELNIYYIATDPLMDSATVEQMYLNVLGSVKQEISIPVAVQGRPLFYFSAFANMATRL